MPRIYPSIVAQDLSPGHRSATSSTKAWNEDHGTPIIKSAPQSDGALDLDRTDHDVVVNHHGTRAQRSAPLPARVPRAWSNRSSVGAGDWMLLMKNPLMYRAALMLRHGRSVYVHGCRVMKTPGLTKLSHHLMCSLRDATRFCSNAIT